MSHTFYQLACGISLLVAPRPIQLFLSTTEEHVHKEYYNHYDQENIQRGSKRSEDCDLNLIPEFLWIPHCHQHGVTDELCLQWTS